MYASTYRTNDIRFHINGKEHIVPKFAASRTLNDYLRETAGLKGTKVMCREAGCGCCSVAVTNVSAETNKLETYSVQSCLTPLYSVDGWQVTTVEGIGSQKDGFHPVQERIAKFNGSQCGYCTPGMVMNMYGLLHQHPQLTSQDVEDNFDGNICRCTGYRPILDAMKSFAGNKPIDIEDLNKNLCPKTGDLCTGEHAGKGGTRCLDVQVDGARWFRPNALDDLGNILRTQKDKQIKLVFGNTASGIFKNEGPFDVFIDLHQVKQLFSYQVNSDNVKFGAATSLTNFISKLKANQDAPGFHYFAAIVRHIKFVANVMVRNAGTIAGNLMIKHNHPEFPSDIFTTLEAAGAKVEIFDSRTSKQSVATLLDFKDLVDMKGKVVTAIILPKFDENTVYRSFKITPRWQNAHAYINAGFKITSKNRKIKGQPRLVIGGINAQFVHAVKTEKFLDGKTLSDQVVKEALKILHGELDPEADLLLASPKYRRELCCSLLYKVLLQVYSTDVKNLKSGSDNLHRPISTGLQTYQEMKSEFPLKEPLPKKTAPLQASGEAQFINDIPTFQHEAFGAFVISQQAAAQLESIDTSEALKMPGVLKFISAKDIPEGGSNNYMNKVTIMAFMPQELFATKDILFAGQPLGLIVAETQSQANAAAKAVKVNYCNVQKPILSIEESIAAGRELPVNNGEQLFGNPDAGWKDVTTTVEGEVRMGSQYHFYMETHVSLAVPIEDGLDVYSATQFPQMNHVVAAEVIGMPLNYVNLIVPRIGGAFGGKGWDSCSMTAAASLAAHILGKPVRVSLDLSTGMRMCGKRAPIFTKYKAGCDDSGVVKVVELDFYWDAGSTPNNCMEVNDIVNFIDMGYYIPNWKIKKHPMFTNKQTMSPCRAPGSVPAAFMIESIMEHVSKAVNKHPIIVKELNLYESHQFDPMGHEMTDCTLRELWRRTKDMAEVEGRMRQVEAFNQENLWKKRGITMTTCKYGMHYFGPGFTCVVSIFAQDGTVAVSQGGVEMGQGLYMKVAQGVAQTLGIPVDMIKVRPNHSIITPNCFVTGGSTTSEATLEAAIGAAQILKDRMQPIKDKFPDSDWKDLCGKSLENNVDLSGKFTKHREAGKVHYNYFTYCVAAVETEVDILTGESQVRRVDIMCDFGESLNPTIDIGQVEGAFVMGLGCFLSEDIKFDAKTGRIMTDGTWEYKPPTTKDIPIDWRIHLLPDRPNPAGIRSSKATGEPPICLSVGALLANKLAIQSARKDIHGADDYIQSVAPFTVEKAQQSVGLGLDNFKLQ